MGGAFGGEAGTAGRGEDRLTATERAFLPSFARERCPERSAGQGGESVGVWNIGGLSETDHEYSDERKRDAVVGRVVFYPSLPA